MQLRPFATFQGWRRFAGEVGIIVLGVLIALGAQQVVDTINQQRQLRELRAAVDQEIAYGLGTLDARTVQRPCFEARLDELDRWLGSWRKGEPLVLPGPISAPRSGPAGKSVWEGRDAGILSNMPLQDKLAYGAIYDQLANYEVQRLDERMTWLELAEYDGAQKLDESSMMRLRGLITRARWRGSNIHSNAEPITGMTGHIGIRMQSDRFPPGQYAELCRPILPKG